MAPVTPSEPLLARYLLLSRRITTNRYRKRQRIVGVEMWKQMGKVRASSTVLMGLLMLWAAPVLGSEILGELRLVAAGPVEKLAGVWVDGQYVGYVEELKGSKKLVLLPGQYEIRARFAGYREFVRQLLVQPGRRHLLHVQLEPEPEARYPAVTAEVKLSVSPSRAAVFLNDMYVGHVGLFNGPGQALAVAPGKHVLRITLPGYQSFEMEVELAENQQFELKTSLIETSIQAGVP